jgi:hypothetical protein
MLEQRRSVALVREWSVQTGETAASGSFLQLHGLCVFLAVLLRAIFAVATAHPIQSCWIGYDKPVPANNDKGVDCGDGKE